MKSKKLSSLALAGLLALGAGWLVTSRTTANSSTPAISGMMLGTPDIKSAGEMTFGPDNMLFVGDSQSAAVFAIDVKDTAKDSGAEPIKIENIDRKVASLLGTTPDAVMINDLPGVCGRPVAGRWSVEC